MSGGAYSRRIMSCWLANRKGFGAVGGAGLIGFAGRGEVVAEGAEQVVERW